MAPRARSGRIFLTVVFLGLVAAGGLHGRRGANGGGDRDLQPEGATQRPNVLLILTDDLDLQLHSLDYMPRVKALLSDQGTTFSHFFVPLSLCCPSRASILLGQYPHNHQIYTDDLPDGGFQKFRDMGHEAVTVAAALQAAGYRTAMAGKYLNGYPDAGNPTYVPPGWDEWHVPANDDAYSEFNYELNEQGVLAKFGSATTDYLTDVLRARSNRFLHDSQGQAQPFFLYAAPYAPHKPAVPAPRHQSLFANVRAPRTPSFNEADMSDKPIQFRDMPPLSAADVANIDRLYRLRIESLQAVDDLVQKLVTTLAATGQLDRTYIFFTSDNGFHMGQHRLLPSKYTAYEEDIRVPLIVRGPGVPAGRVIDELTSTIDLAPTFAELAGAALLAPTDGRSLVALWRQAPHAVAWRQTLLIEQPPFPPGQGLAEGDTGGTGESPRRGHAGVLEPPDEAEIRALAGAAAWPVALAGLRTRDYKYVEYANGEREYYDLKADPYELASQHAHLDPAYLARLSQALKTLVACAGASCRSADAAPPPAR